MTIQHDKVLHFLGGAIIAMASYPLLHLYALWLVIAIGALKEGYDRLHPDKHMCEFWDFAATVLGGMLIVGLLTFLGV